MPSADLSPSASRPRRPPIGGLVAELVITGAILATMATVASATYGSYVRGAARTEVKTFVSAAAERQARFLADRGRYADSLTVLDLALPASLEGRYVVAVTAVDGPVPTFAVTASAQGDQAGDRCPHVAIDHAGHRTPANCW